MRQLSYLCMVDQEVVHHRTTEDFSTRLVSCTRKTSFTIKTTNKTRNEAYRIVLFDQRGCGKSRPYASVEENTTPNLVSDLDVLRNHISAEKWGLFGGSWGSTLALAYCQTHPETVNFVILRGIFLGRQTEIEWLYERGGAAHLFPHDFEKYRNGLPENKRNAPSLLQAYYSILSGPQCEARDDAIRGFSLWESALSYFPGRIVRRRDDEYKTPRISGIAKRVDDRKKSNGQIAGLAISILESHYFVNGCFFKEDGELLKEERMKRVRQIPAAIVQGRWDMVCPVRSAYDLANAWPEATFDVIPNAGHSAFEVGTRERLVELTDKFRGLGRE